MRAPAGAGGRGWALALAVALVVLACDQATKAAVRGTLERGERSELALGVDLVRVGNRGIAFGILDGGGAIVLVVTLAALGLVVGWFARDPARPGAWLAVGLLLGGALGNLADRAFRGAVTDFLDPPLWPAFNLADVAITAGAAMLVLTALWPREQEAPP